MDSGASDIMQDFVQDVTIGQLVIAAAICGSAWALIRKLGPGLVRLVHMLDDFQGEPARPGVQARPGMLERMSTMEAATRGVADGQVILTRQMTVVVDSVAQLSPNGGSTMRDSIARIEKDTASLSGRTPVTAT